jgi:hypothetical protein
LRTLSRIAAGLALFALGATPALAATPPSDTPDRSDNPGLEHRPSDGTAHKPATPGPSASLPAKAKAYGRRCQGQSKKRSDAAEGTRGTPFSQCVTAMAKLATDKTDSPRKACKDLSKKHTEGKKGTPFSACVTEGAQLLREQKRQNGG